MKERPEIKIYLEDLYIPEEIFSVDAMCPDNAGIAGDIELEDIPYIVLDTMKDSIKDTVLVKKWFLKH